MDVDNKFNLDYFNALTLILPRHDQVDLTLVGCGGTGSWLAPAVVRIGKLLSKTVKQIHILFVDPDTVEEKNTIRQNFCAAEIGQPKAMALATRYSGAWGIEISYFPKKLNPELFNHPWGTIEVIIGCVDNAAARKDIQSLFDGNYRHDSLWWLDCGNERSYGQILLGGGEKGKELPGYCSWLPLPSEQHPELVQVRAVETGNELSCAEMAVVESQGLSINQRVAAEAADYLVRMLITKDLKKYATYMDLESGTTISKYITNTTGLQGEK